MFVTPTPYIDHDGQWQKARLIPDPDRGDILPEEGRDVPETDYWTRRLRDGDVVLGEPPTED